MSTSKSSSGPSAASDWIPNACILCECNCGIEVQLGGEGGRQGSSCGAITMVTPHRGAVQGD
jgi:hypothetical protein